MSLPANLRMTIIEEDPNGTLRRRHRIVRPVPQHLVGESFRTLAEGRVTNAITLFIGLTNSENRRNLTLIVFNETGTNRTITLTGQITVEGENSTARTIATLVVNANTQASVSIPVGYDLYSASADANTNLFWRVIAF